MHDAIKGISNIIEKNINNSIIEIIETLKANSRGKQVGGDILRGDGDTRCQGNNIDEVTGCYLDPISLECFDDDNFILTPHNECFQPDGLCRYLRERGVNTSPLSRREYDVEWIREACGHTIHSIEEARRRKLLLSGLIKDH